MKLRATSTECIPANLNVKFCSLQLPNGKHIIYNEVSEMEKLCCLFEYVGISTFLKKETTMICHETGGQEDLHNWLKTK